MWYTLFFHVTINSLQYMPAQATHKNGILEIFKLFPLPPAVHK